ncbi:MAG: hypothetical protein ACXVGH_12555, partial [Mycobacteriales bacterium]
MRGPRTLSGRLALSGMVAAALAVLLLTTAFALLLERRLDAEAENVLRGRAEAAAATVGVNADGSLELNDNDRDRDGALDTGIWIYQGRTAVERSPGSSTLQAQADALAGTAGRLVRRDAAPATLYLSV